MKKRLLSLVLCLVMVFSLLPFAGFADEPEDSTVITNPDAVVDGTGNLHLSKTLSQNPDDGTYSINLESFATADVSTVTTTEKIPTDFIVIVDQSGSMATTDMAASKDSYTKVTGSTYPNLETVAAGRYYYLDESTGQYYRVYGKHGYLYYKYLANTRYANDFYGTSLFYYFSDETTTASGANGYYYYNTEDQAWYPISMAVEGHLIGEQSGMLYECRFSYDRNGTKVALPYSSSRSYHAYRQFLWDRIDAGSDKIVYDFYRRYIGYNGLFYRDINGREWPVPTVTGETTTNYCTSDGANAVTTENGSQQMRYNNLYTLKSGSANVKTRLEALTQALNEFSAAVAAETDTFGAVDNKVAIVGFSSEGYKNTEILTGSDIGYGNNGSSFSEGSYYFPYKGQNYDNATTGSSGATNYTGPQYYNESGTGIVRINNTHYKNALIAANNGTAGTVNPDLTKAIKSIGAYGGTHPENGFDMAANIIQQRTTKQYTLRSGEHKGEPVNRNVIVIYFTDGRPSDYTYSNQYDGANAVIHKAQSVKNLGASVFSIGVFGESDGNPLTYGIKHYAQNQNDAANQDEIYDVDYVDQYYAGTERTKHDGDWVNHTYYNYYYLYRGWIPGQSTTYGDTANDTIYDYMSVTSSNYPSASYFIDPNWNSANESWKNMTTRVRGTAPETNNYYRMASNQDTLVAAFEAAVTMIHTNTDEQQTVTLDSTAILRDTVNTTALDVSGATYTAKRVPIKYDNGNFTEDEDRTATVISGHENVQVPANGQISVDGFNYKDDRTSATNPEGWKLVVTISGLTPKQIGTEVETNVGSAGIYGPSTEKPAVSIASPKLNAAGAAKSYVIDYNAKTKLAKDVTRLAGADNNGVLARTNGNYVKSGTDVTYQLKAGTQAGTMDTNKEYRATINGAYTAVDKAMVYGKAYDLNKKAFAASKAWTELTAVPASSVYYDDSFTETDAQVLDHPGDVVAKTGTFDGVNSHIFTFYGTGIDVYCTTIDNGGYVSARVYRGTETTGNGIKTITVKNQSQGAYYNTPTVHFDLETADVYTIWLYANGKANYQIDGVRVYNPVKAAENDEPTEAAAELANTDEANAHYFNLHEMLLNDKTEYNTISDEKYKELDEANAVDVSGILYLDNAAKICLQSNDENGNPQLIFESAFDLYKTNSPINEIYLQNGQGVAFKLNNWKSGEKVYLGVSAPKLTNPDPNHPVKVLVNGYEQEITSCVDQYYDITGWITNGVVSIKTVAGDQNLISITNLKITGVTMEEVIGQNLPAEGTNGLNSVRRLAFAPMTTVTVEQIAEETVPDLFVTEIDPEPTPAPDPQPTTEPTVEPTVEPTAEPDPQPTSSIVSWISNLFSNFVNNLFGSIARLFGH